MSIGLYSFIYAPTRMLEWDKNWCWMNAGLQALVQIPEIIQKLEEREKDKSLDDFENELLKILHRLKKPKGDKAIKAFRAVGKGNPGLLRFYNVMIDKEMPVLGKMESDQHGDIGQFIGAVVTKIFGDSNLVYDLWRDSNLVVHYEKDKINYAAPEIVDTNVVYNCLHLDVHDLDYQDPLRYRAFVPLTLESGGVKYELAFMLLSEAGLIPHGTVMVKQEDRSWWYFNDFPTPSRKEINLKNDLNLHVHNGIEYILNFDEKIFGLDYNKQNKNFAFGEAFFYRRIDHTLQENLNRLKEHLTVLKNKLLSLRTQIENLRTKLGK